jgi:hypothetical protein
MAIVILAAFFVGCSPALAAPAASSSPSRRAPVRLTGLDPYETGCAADAVTASRAEARDATGALVAFVDLRRSARCGTSWARAVRVANAKGTLLASVRGQASASAFEHRTDGEVWTDMVPAEHGCATATGGIRPVEGASHEAQAAWCYVGRAAGLASR